MSTVDCTNELEVGGVYVGSFTVPVEGTTGQYRVTKGQVSSRSQWFPLGQHRQG